VSQEPRHHVVFANAQFHVLDVNIPPGDTSLDHRHEFDLATVSMCAVRETWVWSSNAARWSS